MKFKTVEEETEIERDGKTSHAHAVVLYGGVICCLFPAA